MSLSKRNHPIPYSSSFFAPLGVLGVDENRCSRKLRTRCASKSSARGEDGVLSTDAPAAPLPSEVAAAAAVVVVVVVALGAGGALFPLSLVSPSVPASALDGAPSPRPAPRLGKEGADAVDPARPEVGNEDAARGVAVREGEKDGALDDVVGVVAAAAAADAAAAPVVVVVVGDELAAPSAPPDSGTLLDDDAEDASPRTVAMVGRVIDSYCPKRANS